MKLGDPHWGMWPFWWGFIGAAIIVALMIWISRK